MSPMKQKQKPIYVLRLTTALPDDPPAKPQVFEWRKIAAFDTQPGAEWKFVREGR